MKNVKEKQFEELAKQYKRTKHPYFPVVKVISMFLPALCPSFVGNSVPMTTNPYWCDGSREKITSNVLSSRQA
jgi:hypothetical protein